MQRRPDIDWLRGLAILIMVEAHVIDSWTRVADRTTSAFGIAMIVAGFAAPGFLFLAGVGSVLAIGARRARDGNERAAARKVTRRGWEIFGLAFLFRLQSLVLNPGAPLAGILKVDILNIMGPAIALCGAIFGWLRRPAHRLAAFALLAAACTLLAPIVRVTPLLAWLPDPVEWYLRPPPNRGTFTMFPWAGFLFAGGLVGLLLDAPRSPRGSRRFHAVLIACGMALGAAGYGASFLPPIYRQSSFWTTSPTFFFLRTGILVAAVGVAYFWSLHPRLTPVGRFAPLERFGRASLFVYWVHVELVYGWFSRSLHKRLTIGQAGVAFLLLTLALMAAAFMKQDLARRWRQRRRPPAVAQPAVPGL